MCVCGPTKSLKMPATIASLTSRVASLSYTHTQTDRNKNSVHEQKFRPITDFHIRSETIFKGCHGSEGSRSHGDVGEFVSRAMSMYSVEVWSHDVDPTQDEVGTNVALVGEQVLFQHSQSCGHSWLQKE